jgi:predicted nucleic acid-binding protein
VYAALLDACVLVPSAISDTLLRLAEARLFRPLWSPKILEETYEAILRIRPDLSPERIRRRIELMDASFEDASVIGYEDLVAGLDLPDQDDRHVLAAAIAGHAQSLVTFNLKDFPAAALQDRGVETAHPDQFLLDQLDLRPGVVLAALHEQVAALSRPPTDLAGVLNHLKRSGVPRFADEVRLLAL